eukprot:1138891-Pelagomonas_calceolata.AAC.6
MGIVLTTTSSPPSPPHTHRYGVIEQQFVASRMVMATRMWQALLQQHAQQQQQQQQAPMGSSSSGSSSTANPTGPPAPPSTMPPAVRGVVGVATSSAWPPPQGPLPVWLAQVACCIPTVLLLLLHPQARSLSSYIIACTHV